MNEEERLMITRELNSIKFAIDRILEQKGEIERIDWSKVEEIKLEVLYLLKRFRGY